MVNEFNNQWTIILGGSSGLGLASAKKLAKQGMNLCIIHRNTRIELEEIKKDFEEIQQNKIQFLSYNLDALNPEKRQTILQDLVEIIPKNHVRCLLHSLSQGNLKPLIGNQSLSTEDMLATLHAMSVSLHDWVKLVFEAELFAKNSQILAFTSQGNLKPIPNYGAVSMAKASLEALSRQLAFEYAPYGIKSNCIQAGVVNTKSLNKINNSHLILQKALEYNPNNRLTTPEDVANVVYLLCKDEAQWINGSVIKVDGGESMF